MAYRSLGPSDHGAYNFDAPSTGPSRRAFIRPLSAHAHRPVADNDIPLLGISPALLKKPSPAKSDKTQVWTLEDAHLLPDQSREFDIPASNDDGSITSFRERLASAIRYIRASGPASKHNFSNESPSLNWKLPTGWRLGTWVSCFAVVLCILLEIGLLIYGFQTSSNRGQPGVLLEGNCEEVRELELWLLLPLNIAGTVLISASNYVMQVVSAPSRSEIDKAHACAETVSVPGVQLNDFIPNKRNKFRHTIWYILALSSVPIHFFLNVAVYSSIQASNSAVLVVSDDFESDAGWQDCEQFSEENGVAETTACSLRSKFSGNETIELTPLQCLRQYSDGFQTNASSVIVVTDKEVTPWYSPPITSNLTEQAYSYFDIPCRSNSYGGYEKVDSGLQYLFYLNERTGNTTIGLNFSPFCSYKTEKQNGKDLLKLSTTDRSSEQNKTTSTALSFRSNSALSKVSSVRAFFSAFEYRYWAAAAGNGEYLRDDLISMQKSRDPRSWVCPRDYLLANRQCDPLTLQLENEWRVTPMDMPVRRCHVLPKEEKCALRYNVSIFILTICFDVVKLGAMVVAIKWITNPLATLGDLIQSFLQDSDHYTVDRQAIDDDEANEWVMKAKRVSRASAFEYLKKSFGVNVLVLTHCPGCGRRIQSKVKIEFRETVNFGAWAPHQRCGLPVADRTFAFEQKCFEWQCGGGIGWTKIPIKLHREIKDSAQSRRWEQTLSKKRWYWFLRLYMLTLAIAAMYFGVNLTAILRQRLSNTWTVGFAAPDPNSIIMMGNGFKNIFGAGALVNAPQLAFSILYFIFNAMLTMMHTAHEWASFAVQRKALRVSSPRGLQRSTYWLQLPWSYSVPLVLLSGSMHWLLSRSLYVVKIDVYGYFGEREQEKDYFACGYSPVPALVLVIVLFLMGVVMAGLSFRRLPTGMPFVRLNSLAVAASCHPDPTEVEPWLKPLIWGRLNDYMDDGRPRYSFTTQSVIQPPDDDGHFVTRRQQRKADLSKAQSSV